MTLLSMMTATATTTRLPAMASDKIGDPVSNLSGVKIMPVMLPDSRGQSGQHQIRQAIGMDGTAIQIYETYTESHEHVDSTVTVTQMPDIIRGDRLTSDSVTYNVRWSEQQPGTVAFGATLLVYLTKDERA